MCGIPDPATIDYAFTPPEGTKDQRQSSAPKIEHAPAVNSVVQAVAQTGARLLTS